MPKKNIEQKLYNNPENQDNYLVYADILQAEGDPRGELILMDYELHKNKKNTDLKKARHNLFEKYKEQFLGEELIQLINNDLITLDWELGFIKSARVANHWDEDIDDPLSMLTLLINHPSAQLLQKLTLGMFDLEEVTFDQPIKILTEAPIKPPLRHIYFGDFIIQEDTEISWSSMGSLDKFWKAYPHLNGVILQSGDMELGNIELPEATSFEVRSGGLNLKCIKSISNAHWPKLEKLIIWFGASDYGAAATVNNIQTILDGNHTPNLKHLGLMNSEISDEICKALITSSILPKLETLDLSMGIMSDVGAKIIEKNISQFKHLKKLNLDQNYITDVGTDLLLIDSNHNISINEQEEDDDYDDEVYRYVSVGE